MPELKHANTVIHPANRALTMTSVSASPAFWDRLGISLSGLCMVHCMVMPVVVAAVPLGATAETVHGWLHPVLLLALVPLTVLALVSTRGKPQAIRIRLVFGVGLLLIVLAPIFSHETASPVVETGFTLLGSGLLIVGHWRNRHTSRCCVQ